MSINNYSIDGLCDLLTDLNNITVFLSTDCSWLSSHVLESLRSEQSSLIESISSYASVLKHTSLSPSAIA